MDPISFKGNSGDVEVCYGSDNAERFHVVGLYSDVSAQRGIGLTDAEQSKLFSVVDRLGGLKALGKVGAVEHHPLSDRKTVITVGLGETGDFEAGSKVPGYELQERVRRAVGQGIQDAASLVKRSGVEGKVSIAHLGLAGATPHGDLEEARADAAVRAGYQGNKAFVGMESGKRLTGIELMVGPRTIFHYANFAGNAAAAENKARRLFEEPHNVITPHYLMGEFRDLASSHRAEGMSVQVNYGKGDILAHAEGTAFAGLASVALASPEADFLHLRYDGNSDDSRRFALLGKGITFDSGGVSIKPADDMDEMDGDMGGAATIYGTLEALARLRVPINIDAYIGITENNIGENASKPGRRLNFGNDPSGKPFPTAYVINTDAEGRLVLATGAAFADRKDVEALLSFSTLTGAMVGALGKYYAGGIIADRHNPTIKKVVSAFEAFGERTYELFHHFRPVPGQEERIKDSRGGIRNVGGPGKYGAMFDGYHFVKAFAGDMPYVHLDIAPSLDGVAEQSYLNSRFGTLPVMASVYALSRLAHKE